MDYTAHLAAHAARLAREQAAQASSAADRHTALAVSCEEAQAILHRVILPELDAARAAMLAAGHSCLLKISRTRFENIPADFEIEISLDHAAASLTYRADPRPKLFHLALRMSATGATEKRILRYDEITPAIIAENCGAFMQAVFPA